MATLTGNQIKDTYYKLVQVDNGQLVQNGIGSPLTGSINLSGSLHVTGSQTVGGDLTVTGDVKARAFITELTQSTVLFKSGSTAFGDDATDTHSFSGSVTMHNSLALGNYANVSASLDAAEDAIIANSQSAHTHRVALDTILSASVDAHLDANISALSSSVDTHLDANITALSSSVDTHLDANITSLSGSSHTRREEISSSFATTIAGLDASGFATDAELSAVSGAFDTTVDTLASTGSNTFTADQTYSSSLHISGALNANGNVIGINEDARIIAIPKRVQFRIIPTASGHLRGNLSVTYDGTNDQTVAALYAKDVQIGQLVENGLYAENIKVGTTSSLFQITGSTAMSGSLKLGDFADVSASLDAANDSIIANSSSAHTQRTAISGALATTIAGLDASGFATDAELSAVSGAFDTTIDNIVAANVSHSAGIVDIPGKKIQYSNVYSTEGDLPSATTYHGMFAHVHATGLGYFAHGGNWIKLASSGSEASAVRAEYVAADTALSSSAHTQRTALSASSAAVFETSASVASDYISIERLKTIITGSYAEFQAAISAL